MVVNPVNRLCYMYGPDLSTLAMVAGLEPTDVLQVRDGELEDLSLPLATSLASFNDMTPAEIQQMYGEWRSSTKTGVSDADFEMRVARKQDEMQVLQDEIEVRQAHLVRIREELVDLKAKRRV